MSKCVYVSVSLLYFKPTIVYCHTVNWDVGREGRFVYFVFVFLSTYVRIYIYISIFLSYFKPIVCCHTVNWDVGREAKLKRLNPPSLSMIAHPWFRIRILYEIPTYFLSTSSSHRVKSGFMEIRKNHFFEFLSRSVTACSHPYSIVERGLSVLHQSVSFGSPALRRRANRANKHLPRKRTKKPSWYINRGLS